MRILALLLLALPALAQLPAPTDWKSVEEETLKHFQALLRIDTADPPNVEKPAVEYLQRVLDAEGIPYKLVAKQPDRPSLIARLKGSGKKRPILIMGHTDVVNVDPAKWKFPPFSATRDGGYIYGRGTVDDKDNLTAALMTMVLLKRLKVPLDRDVIFLAEAAEEGNSDLGAGFVAAEHFADVAAEYCLAEGGGVARSGGTMVGMFVATTEKVPSRADLVVKGTAGHGSVPLPDNAIARLSAAVAKAAAYQAPMKLNDTTRAFIERIAVVSSPEVKQKLNSLLNPATTAEVQEYLRLNEPAYSSMLRTSISPTVIQGGYRENVIPAEARATLDIRALPDEELDQFFAGLKKAIDDDSVEIVRKPRTRNPTPPSRIDTEMFAVLESAQKRLYPGGITVPNMLTGATDMAYFREKGTQCYGIGPLTDREDYKLGYGAHSDQERILETELYRFTRFHYEIVAEIARAK